MRIGVLLIPALAAALAMSVRAAAAALHPAAGFIYGSVETRGGQTYTGLLRWDGEESFWDDLFNSAKVKLPFMSYLPGEERTRRKKIELFGVDLDYKWTDSYQSRQFVTRFGDIEEIRVLDDERADVRMKGGEVYEIEGASNDVDADVSVRDEVLGEIEIPWRRIERISFRATPATVRPEVSRLQGVVTTDDGSFEGFIQWDSQECLSTDKLDGDSEDGRMSIAMGRIRSIEKHGRDRCLVRLKDGRELVLGGTNDVDASLRGIFVETGRTGRVKVSWEAFSRAEFRDGGGTGRGYDEYPAAAALSGRVIDAEGRQLRGRIVIDLDETRGWEFLNGKRLDVEYYLPLADVKSIAPRGGRASRVVLRNGTELVLEDQKDVSEDNDGVVVLTGAGDKGTYLRWREVERIEFD